MRVLACLHAFVGVPVRAHAPTRLYACVHLCPCLARITPHACGHQLQPPPIAAAHAAAPHPTRPPLLPRTPRRTPAGVHGRLSELGRVTSRRYNLAMSVALGQHMDSVVVDDRAAAFKAIDWLKRGR